MRKLERRTFDADLQKHILGEDELWSGTLPATMLLGDGDSQRLWDLHPSERFWLTMLGKRVQAPRLSPQLEFAMFGR